MVVLTADRRSLCHPNVVEAIFFAEAVRNVRHQVASRIVADQVAHELMGMQVWLVQAGEKWALSQSKYALFSKEFCECGTWGSHCVSPRNAWAGLCEAFVL